MVSMLDFSQSQDLSQVVDEPRALRSWRLDDFALLAGCILASTATTWLIYTALTPATGKTGFFIITYIVFLLLYVMTCTLEVGRQSAFDNLWTVLTWSAALLLLAPLTTILLYVIVKGFAGLELDFFRKDLSTTGTLDAGGGAAAAIIGTLQQVFIAVLIAVPLSLLTAIYLNEVRGRFRRPVRMFVDAMSGIPSIVAGLFIYAVWIIALGNEFSGFAASLALSILMLPTITRTAEEVLRLVPNGLREGALALGATRWKTTLRVVMPTAASGLITAIVLGVARAVGETAPLIMTSFGSTAINSNPLSGAQDSLPLFVYRLIANPFEAQQQRAWTGALVLVIVVLVLFTIARVLGAKASGKGR
jgi:phosphate transport system permease protein